MKKQRFMWVCAVLLLVVFLNGLAMVRTFGTTLPDTPTLASSGEMERQRTAEEAKEKSALAVCLSEADRLIERGQYRAALKKLDGCGQVEKRSAVLRPHFRITSMDIARKLYPEDQKAPRYLLFYNPAKLENKSFEIVVIVFQKLDPDNYLCWLGLKKDSIILMRKSARTDAPFRFVDGQALRVMGIVRGDYTYSTTSGGSNTVTRIEALWAESLY